MSGHRAGLYINDMWQGCRRIGVAVFFLGGGDAVGLVVVLRVDFFCVGDVRS